MANGNNSPRTFTSYPGSSFSKSPSLEMRALAQSRALDGGYQKTSSMWSQVTRNRYPSGKMKVVGSSSSKKDPGLQSDLDYMQSIYDVLGMQFSGGGRESFKANPFNKGSFAFPVGKSTISGNYERKRSGHGLRNYDFNIGLSVPLDFKFGKRR
tara:strand:+ start:211 stop:672 length:462 start_codon:yes stop_codon:yes gene_type:complete